MELAALAIAGSGTALATGVGALPVSRLGEHAAAWRPALWGLTVGLMTVASIVGLLLPAHDEGTGATVVAGLATGVAFLLISRSFLARRNVHVGALRGAGVRRSVLVPSRDTPALDRRHRGGRPRDAGPRGATGRLANTGRLPGSQRSIRSLSRA